MGAPNADRDGGGSGVIQILFGGPRGIRTNTTQTIPRPVDAWAGFGTKLRAGDVNGDHRVDLVEGAPDETTPGHLSVCTSPRKGRRITCHAVVGPVSSGTSGLAVADVNGDRIDDVIQGDSVIEFAASGQSAPGGEVRVYRGHRHSGPSGDDLFVLDQSPGAILGNDEPGDEFGATVDAGDLDDDGYADIVVSAPGEDELKDGLNLTNVGSVSVLRGGRSGKATSGNSRFFPTHGIPRELAAETGTGWSLAVLDSSGDDVPDVAVSLRGADRIQDSVYVIEGRGKGSFAPGETKVWRPLRGTIDVRDPMVARIRIGRADGA